MKLDFTIQTDDRNQPVTILPQGLCTGCSLCEDALPKYNPVALCFKSRGNHHLLRGRLPGLLLYSTSLPDPPLFLTCTTFISFSALVIPWNDLDNLLPVQAPSFPLDSLPWGQKGKGNLFLFCSLFFFFFNVLATCHATCGILAPRPGIETAPPALEARSLNHWTTREVLDICFEHRWDFQKWFRLWNCYCAFFPVCKVSV